MVEGREQGICDWKRQVVFVELRERCFEVSSMSTGLGKGVCLILKPPHQLDH